MAIQPPPQATTPEFFPIAPARTEDSGLPVARLADLLLKHIYFKSPMSAKDWAAALCLPYQTVTPAIQSLVEQGWAQTIGRMAGPSQSHDFGETLGYLITDPGRLRARDVLARDHYVGPAPVPFAQYDISVRAQVSQADVTAAWLTRALQHLTLSPDLLVQLGPPVNARAPLFLYGAPGNGKTTIAEACAELLGEPIYIPYAIDIEGQVMRLYDPLHHQRVQRQLPGNFDPRWVMVKRPFVKAGGELTTSQLSPSFDPLMRYYEAPIHLKANGGIFLLDDFGRQDSSPRALLNRLIVALERRIDYLTLAGAGMAVGAPFEAMVVFSTNLEARAWRSARPSRRWLCSAPTSSRDRWSTKRFSGACATKSTCRIRHRSNSDKSSSGRARSSRSCSTRSAISTCSTAITSHSNGRCEDASRATSSTNSTRWRTFWAAPRGSSRT